MLIVGVKKAELRRFEDLFRNTLFRAMRSMEITSQYMNEILDETLQFVVGKTNNRSVLGSMNDYISCTIFQVQHDGDYQNINIYDLTARLNEMPMSAIGYSNANDQIKKALQQHNKAL